MDLAMRNEENHYESSMLDVGESNEVLDETFQDGHWNQHELFRFISFMIFNR